METIAMWYVYILNCQKNATKYVGSANDLRRRIREHQQGRCESTRHLRPVELEAYIAVKNESVARELEK